MTKIRRMVVQGWHPEPLQPPIIDSDLPALSPVERSAEVLRYTCCNIEYWLSPGGALREWLKFNLRIALAIAVPSLLVIPIITFTLGQFKTWVDLITQTLSNLILVPFAALLVIGLIFGLIYVGKSVMVMRMCRPHSEPF